MPFTRKRSKTLESPVPIINNDHSQSDEAQKISAFEQSRDQRIRENMERMQKIGIFDLSLQLKSTVSAAARKRALRTQSALKPPASGPIRRSSRLKRKGAAPERAAKKPTKEKAAAKDPNKPKRPASAFFVFMEEFRKTYKEKHPNNKLVSVVGKAGGDKWKSLSEAEKTPYVQKAEKRKTEYDKNMEAYNKKLAEGTNAADEEEEESDKSKSEVHDDDEDGSEEEDDDDAE